MCRMAEGGAPNPHPAHIQTFPEAGLIELYSYWALVMIHASSHEKNYQNHRHDLLTHSRQHHRRPTVKINQFQILLQNFAESVTWRMILRGPLWMQEVTRPDTLDMPQPPAVRIKLAIFVNLKNCTGSLRSILMPPTSHIATLNRHTPKFSGVGLELTWCQPFGV